MSAIRACSFIAGRSLSYVKIMQTGAIRACSFIAERSLSYAKVRIFFPYKLQGAVKSGKECNKKA